MPKIKTQKFYYSMPDMDTCQISMHVNSDGVFYVPVDDFPEQILNFNLLKRDTVYIGKTKRIGEAKMGYVVTTPNLFEQVVQSIIKSATENYKNQNREKIIAFRIKLNGVIREAGLVNKGTDDEYYDTKLAFEEISFSDDREQCGIVSHWRSLYRVPVPNANREHEKFKYYDMQNRSIGHLYGDWKMIGWTKEREDWFKNFDDSLKKMIVAAHQFREANVEMIEKFIDTSKNKFNLLDFKPKQEKLK